MAMNEKELAELMSTGNTSQIWANKVYYNIELSQEEKEISQAIDEMAKGIGNGTRGVHELSEYLQRTMTPEIYDTPDEILDALFERGTIGEFDTYGVLEDAKNTLVAHESAKNANVDKSYIDYRFLKPTWKHIQVDTEVRMDKLRHGGYKTVAELQVFAERALKNKMFQQVFAIADGSITKSINSSKPITQSAAEEMADYLLDRSADPMIVGISSLVRPMGRLAGAGNLASDAMKDEINKYGINQHFMGCRLIPISEAKKMANGELLLPKDKVFGFAGKIGECTLRGGLRAMPTVDNKKELIEVKFTGLEFGTVIKTPENINKILVK